jgi:hypothetical protein
MSWAIFDHRDKRGQNPIRIWCERLQKQDLARMNKKLDLLAQSGHELCPGLGINLRGGPHLYKIKINGRVAARLIFCKGPINMELEYTLLLGAFETDNKLPEGTLEMAESYRKDVIADPANRRGAHERVSR